MKKQTITLLTIVLCGSATVIWTARVIFDIAYGIFEISSVSFLLDILCAIVWIIAFLVHFHRYRYARHETGSLKRKLQ